MNRFIRREIKILKYFTQRWRSMYIRPCKDGADVYSHRNVQNLLSTAVRNPYALSLSFFCEGAKGQHKSRMGSPITVNVLPSESSKQTHAYMQQICLHDYIQIFSMAAATFVSKSSQSFLTLTRSDVSGRGLSLARSKNWEAL